MSLKADWQFHNPYLKSFLDRQQLSVRLVPGMSWNARRVVASLVNVLRLWKDLGNLIMLCIDKDCDDVEAYNVWLAMTSLVSPSRWETMEQVWDTSILGLSERWNADSWGRAQNFHPGIPCPAWIPTWIPAWITSMSNVLPWWWNTSCTTKGCDQRTLVFSVKHF